MDDFKLIMLSERSQKRKYCMIPFTLYEVHKEAKLIYGVRSQGSSYLWKGGTKKDFRVMVTLYFLIQ